MKRMSASVPTEFSPGAPAATAELRALTDQCVMCGLCIPHCPTYRVDANEAESPRGRIALARALASGTFAPTPAALTHLDQCLACLSCQKVCPSGVEYEKILVGTRAALAPARRTSWFTHHVLNDPIRLTALARIAAVMRAARWLRVLARVLPRGSRARRIALTLPLAPPAHPLQRAHRAALSQGRIALFRGCVASVYDCDTLGAASRLLAAAGHDVAQTQGAYCCGALPRHAGAIDAAAAQAQRTRAALHDTGADRVLVCASGCFGDLRDQVLAGSAARAVDIHAFLAADEGFAALAFRPLRQRVALHLPCTQVNLIGERAPIVQLLARIPELEILTLPEQPRCCGAAGSYFIEHPEIADTLRDEKLDQVHALAPDIVLTTNIGCRIHLANGLHDRAITLPVMHPLALLAQQLDNTAQ